MLLFISILIIVGLDMRGWWIFAAIIVWVGHISFTKKQFSTVSNNQIKIFNRIQKLEKKDV